MDSKQCLGCNGGIVNVIMSMSSQLKRPQTLSDIYRIQPVFPGFTYSSSHIIIAQLGSFQIEAWNQYNWPLLIALQCHYITICQPMKHRWLRYSWHQNNIFQSGCHHENLRTWVVELKCNVPWLGILLKLIFQWSLSCIQLFSLLNIPVGRIVWELLWMLMTALQHSDS